MSSVPSDQNATKSERPYSRGGMEHSRLYEQTVQREEWLRASNEIMTSLLAESSSAGKLQLVTERARAVADAPVAAVILPHPDIADQLIFAVVDGIGDNSGLLGSIITMADTAVGLVFRTLEPLLLDESLHDDQGKPSGRLHKLGSAAIVPLAAGGQALGVLLLIRRRGEPPFGESDLGLLQSFAIHAALALQWVRLPEEDFVERMRSLAASSFEYDVVISFGGPDRATAEEISQRLKRSGVRVFYDRDYQHELLGEDLATYLHRTYFTNSRFAIVLLSSAFLESKWAGNWEWRAVLARMQQQRSGYVLPYYLENVEIPGLSPSIGYARAADVSVSEFCNLVVRKLKASMSLTCPTT